MVIPTERPSPCPSSLAWPKMMRRTRRTGTNGLAESTIPAPMMRAARKFGASRFAWTARGCRCHEHRDSHAARGELPPAWPCRASRWSFTRYQHRRIRSTNTPRSRPGPANPVNTNTNPSVSSCGRASHLCKGLSPGSITSGREHFVHRAPPSALEAISAASESIE